MKVEINVLSVDSRSLSKNIFRQLESEMVKSSRISDDEEEGNWDSTGKKYLNGKLVLGKVIYPELVKSRDHHDDAIYFLVYHEDKKILSIVIVRHNRVYGSSSELYLHCDELAFINQYTPQIFLKS